MFSIQSHNVSPVVHIFYIISLFAAELEKPKIGISGKGLRLGSAMNERGINPMAMTISYLGKKSVSRRSNQEQPVLKSHTLVNEQSDFSSHLSLTTKRGHYWIKNILVFTCPCCMNSNFDTKQLDHV